MTVLCESEERNFWLHIKAVMIAERGDHKMVVGLGGDVLCLSV